METEIGKRYGKLVVTKRAANDRGSAFWCICDCGNKTVIRMATLHSGYSQSCGCLRKIAQKNYFDRLKKSYARDTAFYTRKAIYS